MSKRAKDIKKYMYYLKKQIYFLKKIMKQEIDINEEDQLLHSLNYFKSCKKRLTKFKKGLKKHD